MDESLGEESGSFAVFLAPLWILFCGEFRVNKLRILNGKGSRIVIKLPNSSRAIPRPAVSEVKSIEVIEVRLQLRRGVRCIDFRKAEVCEDLQRSTEERRFEKVRLYCDAKAGYRTHSEPKPICIGHIFTVDTS